MAIATKTGRTIVAQTTGTAGASGTLDLSTALGCLIMARVVNGATPPATGCLVTVNVSRDGVTWRQYAQFRAETTANLITDWPIEMPAPTMRVQVVFGTTSQPVTVDAIAHELTSIA